MYSMFKTLKYLFLANTYRKAKRNILTIIAMFILLMFSTLLMNDLLDVATGGEKYIFLTVKWIMIFLFLSIIVYNTLKVLNAITQPLSIANSSKPKVVDTKKEHIMAKEQLSTKSDQIMQKYMKVGQ